MNQHRNMNVLVEVHCDELHTHCYQIYMHMY